MRFLLSAVLLVLLAAVKNASGGEFYVSPSGSDAGNCSFIAPCKTLPYTCMQVMAAAPASIDTLYLADGSYAGPCSINYYHLLTVMGDCSNDSAVWIDPTAGQGFYFQDKSIGTVNCLTIHSNTTQGIGIIGRQNAIVDYSHVRFGAMIINVSVSENAKANCLNATIFGNAVYHAAASGLSTVMLGCSMTIQAGTFSAFVWGVAQSYIDAYGIQLSGSQTGLKYILDHSQGDGVTLLPGSGSIAQNGAVVE